MKGQSCQHTLLTILIPVALALISKQSPAALDPTWETCRSACVAQTVTAEGRARVIITKQRARLHLPKTQRPVIKLQLEDDDSDYYDELPDLQVAYRRPELVNTTAEVHADLSDDIKIRLLIARIKALAAYEGTWS